MWRQWTLWQAVYTTVVAALVGLSHAQHYKPPNEGEIKAVLLAGTRGWEDYGSQADICHAYQVLHENGIPDENIIVMMYDDIALNELNPHPGSVFNRPGGPDVYKNIKKDYVGKDVNKDVFFNVLKGNKTAVKGIGSGKVLESGPKDHVFIFHSGHGGPGTLAMPVGDDIMKSKLQDVLNEMTKSSRFLKMFYYIDACHSGSMVNNLTGNSNIYAMTSSNPNETCAYCTNFTGIIYGSEFSFFWLRNTETQKDLRKETVQQQFKKVQEYVKWSHPQEYGDLKLSSTKMSEVFGFTEHPVPWYKDSCDHALPLYQAPVVDLEYRIRTAKDPEERMRLEKKLQDLLQSRKDMDQFFSKLAEEVLSPDKMHLHRETISNTHADITETNIACYENAVTHLNHNCFQLSNDHYVGTQLHVLINLCNLVPEARLVEAMQSVYQKYPVHQVVL